MKKIFALLAIILAFQAGVYAQKPKTVAEQSVPERYVKDFQRQAPDAKNPVWISESNSLSDSHQRAWRPAGQLTPNTPRMP